MAKEKLSELLKNETLDRIKDIKNNPETAKKDFEFIPTSHRFYALSYLKETLTEQDYNDMLRVAWEMSHAPSYYGIIGLLDLFKATKKELIMTKEENNFINNLPDEIIVYRGVRKANKQIKGLSWTSDKQKAKWFSNRFNKNDGKVYKAIIPKKAIFFYSNERKEAEVIVNPYKLKQISEVK